MTILSDFINLFFPPICVCCHSRLITGETHICLSCQCKLPKTGYYKTKDNQLEEYFWGRFSFVRIASFAHFSKDGVIQKITHELKYRNNPQLGVFLGEIAGREIRGSSFVETLDYIIPVPLHPNREKRRGYNQSQKISEGISRITGIPVLTNNLIRVIDNPSQTTKSKYERWTNTEDIFSVKDHSQLDGKHILLIDDIVTTGSTLEACVKTLTNNNSSVNISIFCIGSALN